MLLRCLVYLRMISSKMCLYVHRITTILNFRRTKFGFCLAFLYHLNFESQKYIYRIQTVEEKHKSLMLSAIPIIAKRSYYTGCSAACQCGNS